MVSPIVNHAMEHVWCEPNQDRYNVFKTWRVSPKVGVRHSVNIRHYHVNLPVDSNARLQSLWHVFHVGKVHQKHLGLDQCTLSKWYDLSEAMELNKSLVDVYLSNGAIVPKAKCKIRWMADDSLVLIIKASTTDYGKRVSLGTPEAALYDGTPYSVAEGEVFFRSYRNGLFLNLAWPNLAGNQELPIRSYGIDVFSVADYSQFMSTVNNINISANGTGRGVFFKDGFIETLPSAFSSIYVGSHLSYVFDDSARFIEYHKLSQLGTFLSTRDPGKQKYLLLSSSDYGAIIYRDDVDFYLVSRNASNKVKGIVINRYMDDAVRQVTHNAWALQVNYIDALCNQHSFLMDRSTVEVMAVIRQGGSEARGLPQQFSRIEDLYRLSRPFRLQAMLGVNATLPEWRAEALEASPYTELMSAQFKDLSDELVASAYGYHVLGQAFDPVSYLPYSQSLTQAFDVGYALRRSKPSGGGERSVFVYGMDRKLIHSYGNQQTGQYEVLPDLGSDSAEFIEAYHLIFSTLEDGTIYNSDVTDPDLNHWGYRCYICTKINGTPDESWIDITGNSSYYSITGNTLTWNWALINSNSFFPAVRINNRVLLRTVDALPDPLAYSGNMEFDITAQVQWLGNTVIRRQSIAPASVEIFLNGRSLIRGLDYMMQWPRVIICRKPSTAPIDTVIQVRTYGSCDPLTMLPYPPREVGFVKGGILSVDGEFQVRNDRSCRVLIGGMVFKRSEVAYAEDAEILQQVTDGEPYALMDYVTGIEPYIAGDTAVYRQAAQDIDRRVSNYLTPRLQTIEPELPVTVGDRYRVFSVFLNAIIHEMRFGTLFTDSILDVRYGNVEVDGWISAYSYLFQYDIAVLGFDPEYVIVYPHQFTSPVEVSAIQFSFLRYLIRNYLNGNIELSQAVNIGA